MDGKWYGHFLEIQTENWGVRFEEVRSFQLQNQTECYLPFTNFSVPDSFAPFFDSNRNWDVAILR